MSIVESYVCKKEVDWSLLMEGMTLPLDNQVVFGQIMGRFLKKGESKKISLYLDGKSYDAKITNVNFSPKFNRKSDILQIRYTKNGELSQALQRHFIRSYEYIKTIRDLRQPGDRSMIRLPEDCKEYMAIYTTEYDDSYILETIEVDDIQSLKNIISGQTEREMESEFNYDMKDSTSTIFQTDRIVKIRKLNKKIGDNLKLLYGYRCQICGQSIGEEFGSHIAEAHHIDYFVSSLNNDATNQLIVCPNHHSIIHDTDPIFDRRKIVYVYKNGIEQKLVLNKHL